MCFNIESSSLHDRTFNREGILTSLFLIKQNLYNGFGRCREIIGQHIRTVLNAVIYHSYRALHTYSTTSWPAVPSFHTLHMLTIITLWNTDPPDIVVASRGTITDTSQHLARYNIHSTRFFQMLTVLICYILRKVRHTNMLLNTILCYFTIEMI